DYARNADVQIDHNVIYGNGTSIGQADGIRLNYSDGVISNNEIRDHAGNGIELSQATGTVSANEISGNSIGILASTGPLTLAINGNNQIHHNRLYGIWTSGNVTIAGNTIHHNGTAGGTPALPGNGAGILAVGGAITGNDVFSNYEGIVASQADQISGNRV